MASKKKKIKNNKGKKASRQEVSVTPPIIQVSSDDYVLIDIGKGKPKLAMVLGTTGDRAILEEGIENEDNDNHVTFEPEQVVANIGQKPKIGSYLGVKVEPFRKTIHNDEWGDIHVYRSMKAKEKRALFGAMEIVYGLLKKKASLGFLPLHQIKIRNKGGKYAGSYTFKQKGDDRLDKIELFPITFEDKEYNTYLLAHECGHGIWYRSMPLEIRSRWVKAYSKRIALEDVNKKVLSALFESIDSYEGTLREYSKEVADEEERLLIKECIRFLKQKRHLGIAEYEMLLGNDSELASKLWPARGELDSVKSDVTEYAMVSVFEFFAESFAYYLTGKSIPKDLTKLMKVTLKKLRRY